VENIELINWLGVPGQSWINFGPSCFFILIVDQNIGNLLPGFRFSRRGA